MKNMKDYVKKSIKGIILTELSENVNNEEN